MRRPEVVLTLALCAVAACAQDDEEARALLDEVEADDYRTAYAKAPGYEQPRVPSTGPHGTHVDIYVNDIVAEALIAEPAPTSWPEGSIIVKDGWNSAEGDDLRFVALMEKRGDVWYWAEFDDGSDLVAAGLDADKCAGCHSAGSDQVRAFALPSP